MNLKSENLELKKKSNIEYVAVGWSILKLFGHFLIVLKKFHFCDDHLGNNGRQFDSLSIRYYIYDQL